MAIDSVIHTNEQSVNRVLQAGLPVALVFWSKAQPVSAAWEKVLNSAAHDYAGKLLVAKVDAEAEAALWQRYQVPTLPAVLVVQQGKVVATLHTQSTAETLTAWLRYAAIGGTQPPAPQAAAQSSSTSGTPRSTSGQAAATGNGHPVTLTDANFDQIIQGNQPVLVDFWAPWCGPCRMVAPAVEEMAKSFQGRAVVGKLNVDENPRIAQRYQIMGIPALYIFKGGKVVEQMVGVQPAATLRQQLARHA